MSIKVSPETIKEAINRVASTEDGQFLLHALMVECEYHKSLISVTDPMIAHYSSVRRGVYAKMRQYIRSEHLKVIEYDINVKVETEKKGNVDGSRDSTNSRSTN